MHRPHPFPPLAALALAFVLPAGAFAADTVDHAAMSHADCPFAAAGEAVAPSSVPTASGQAAFAAMGEIVRMLEADPATDWSTVSITRLREHLRDMDEVTLRAAVTERPVEGGFTADVTGRDRTLEAVRRMVPAHASMLRREEPWDVQGEDLADGVRLTVTSSDPAEATKLRGLGFFGVLVYGDHHRPHHLAMAGGS